MTSLPYIAIFLLCFFIFLGFPEKAYIKNYIVREESFFILQFFFVFTLLIFLGLRGNVYYDWKQYTTLYQIVKPINEYQNILEIDYKGWEIGFFLLASICKLFSKEYLFFQSINSFIDICLIIVIFRKYYKNQYFCLGLLFFYVFNGLPISINLLRNSKTIYIFIFSIDYLVNKKYSKYVVLNLFGLLFHTSSIIYLLVTPFLLKKKNNKYLLLLLFLIGNFFYLQQIDIVSKFLEILLKFLPNNFQKISILIDRYKDGTGYGIKIGYIERLFTFIIFFLFRDKLVDCKNGQVILNSYYIYYFCYLFLASKVTICERIGVLFSYSYWFLYPYLFSILAKRKKALFLFMFVLYSMLKLYVANYGENFQYKSILFSL